MSDIQPEAIEKDLEPNNARNIYTFGNYADERESAAVFDHIINRINLFKVYREVVGRYIQPNILDPEDKRPRIDRILTPTQKLVELGWCEGAIGVELKRSQIKAGPAFAQIADYNRAVWRLNSIGFHLMLNWVFLWPLRQVHQTWASWQSQARLGSVYSWDNFQISFHSGEQTLLSVDRFAQVRLGKLSSGRKAGSR